METGEWEEWAQRQEEEDSYVRLYNILCSHRLSFSSRRVYIIIFTQLTRTTIRFSPSSTSNLWVCLSPTEDANLASLAEDEVASPTSPVILDRYGFPLRRCTNCGCYDFDSYSPSIAVTFAECLLEASSPTDMPVPTTFPSPTSPLPLELRTPIVRTRTLHCHFCGRPFWGLISTMWLCVDITAKRKSVVCVCGSTQIIYHQSEGGS